MQPINTASLTAGICFDLLTHACAAFSDDRPLTDNDHASRSRGWNTYDYLAATALARAYGLFTFMTASFFLQKQMYISSCDVPVQT